MQFTTVALLFFAAIGAVATPVESEFNSLDARAEASANIKYDGVSKHKHSILWVLPCESPLTTWNLSSDLHQIK